MKKTSRRTPSRNTAKPNTATGTIKRHPDGFGFFIPENPESPDVYIPRHSMEGIMTNDKVMVNVEKERGNDRYRGEIIKVLTRGNKTIVGRFKAYDKGGGTIRDEGKGWGVDLVIKKENTMNAKDGELIAAEVLKYPDQGEFSGKIVQVLGDIADPMTDIQRVLLNQNIPQHWPAAVTKEASQFSEEVSEADTKGRKDLRDLNLITIDGATAKDFDDAIYVEMKNDGFQLYVAIADVSHYVKTGKAIDKEAYERGTSVYFPNFVVPMLPEVLSNGLCSLNPNVDRLALVAKMNIDFQGNITKSEFFEAVICSKARVTYGEAQEIIEGQKIAKFEHVAKDIVRAADLAKLLMARRFREGSLELEIPEIQLIIDASGNPVDISRSERLFAHRLIEEMMLAANIAVGKFLSDKEVPALFRIHEPPNPVAITTLEKFMKNFGSRVKLGEGKLQKRLTRALEEFSGQPEAQILNILTLRSMSQAKYSANNVGHFGLGFEHYTHFTSPIRRYPDLIVHRLLKNQIGLKRDYKLMSEDEVASAGQMLSGCEQRAAKAERQIQAIKKARFMEQHVGKEFEGIISSVTKFGVFVLLRQFEVDGLVSLDRLSANSKDKYEFDPENLKLVAPRSGHTYEIGQPINVRVVDANIELGQIDFELADRPASAKTQTPQKGKGQETPYRPKNKSQPKYQPKQPSKEQPNVQRAFSRKTRFEPRHSAQNAREMDELDLDQVEKIEHSLVRDERPSGFDPGKKIMEALQKRGLKPSGAMNQEIPRTQLGKQKEERRKDTRRRDDRNDGGSRPGQPKKKSNSRDSQMKRGSSQKKSGRRR